MYRNKAFLCLLMVLVMGLTGAFAQEATLISPEMIETETVNYAKTAVIQPQTFERVYNAKPTEYYPHTYTVGAEVNNASFVEYHVSRRNQVKGGDVLVTVSLDVDEEALVSTQLTIERLERDYEKGKASLLDEIDRLLEAQLHTTTVYERELADLRLKRAKLAYEQYCYQQENQLAYYREQLAEMEAQNSCTQLVAPVDGIVADLTYKRVGERVYANEPLVTLYCDDGLLLRIDNNNLNFRYGMQVTVTSGVKNNQKIYSGVVVGADDLLPKNRRTGAAYIRVEVPQGEELRLKQLSVSGAGQYLENVLTVPRRATTMNGGKYYVNCLVNGVPQKRCINAGQLTSGELWVVQGLQEGDVVIVE